MKLKDIRDQVVVVTGASSGIGRATARLAAQRGATVVLVARDRKSLVQAAKEIRADGGEAAHVVADVSDLEQVREVSRQALGRFGRIDTWVNNAGVSIYGTCDEVPLDDARQLFDVNYWGVVHGCRVATEAMRESGGAIINVGSALSDRAIPLQGHYSASKQAVKGFTDSLRMELERQGVPIAVTLVKPSSVATPYPRHAQRYMGAEPTLPAPLCAPSVVAEAIVNAAQHPQRDVSVGAGRALKVLAQGAQRDFDRFLERTPFATQTRVAESACASNLHEPVPGSDREEGESDGRVVLRSLPGQRVVRHPGLTLLALGIGTGLGLAALRSGRLADVART